MSNVLEKFRPLTQFEIEEKKPLLIKFGKYTLRYQLFYALNVIRLWQIKEGVLSKFKKIEENPTKNSLYSLSVFSDIAKILWECSDLVVIKNGKIKKVFNPYKLWKQRKLYYKWSMEHVDYLLEQFDYVLNYQTRLFFLLRHHLSLGIIQEERYTKIGLDRLQPGTIPLPKHGLVSSVKEKLKKRKPSIK